MIRQSWKFDQLWLSSQQIMSREEASGWRSVWLEREKKLKLLDCIAYTLENLIIIAYSNTPYEVLKRGEKG